MTNYAELKNNARSYDARPRADVRRDLEARNSWATQNDRTLRSHGRVSMDIAGMTPMSESSAQYRKAREAAWAERTLTSGTFATETRSAAGQSYDMARKAEKHYTDMAIRARKPRPSAVAFAQRADAAKKAREAARAAARAARNGQ